MQSQTSVDRRFLGFISDLLLCSRCLLRGVRTRVRQVISPHHRPQSLCPACRGEDARPRH